jgi:uracil-DNA glycosylase
MTPNQQRAYSALGLGPLWQTRPPLPIVAGPADDAALSWEELATRVSDCQRCGLCSSRRQTVFGVGPHDARLLIVGEAPGQEEDASGEPFVGQAGKLLDQMLAAIGLNRLEHVFIANVLKCRPPGNRNPEPTEVAACTPYLQRQIALLQPQLILVMGRFAAQSLLATDATIASLRERQHAYLLAGQNVPVVVTYHPAYLLRNLPDKSKAWADLLFARRLLDQLSTPT